MASTEKKIKGYGNLLEDKTGLLKHREWRGLSDTLFDFGFWMKNRMVWGLIRTLRHEAFKKGEDRYRWTVTYRILPHYYDMQCSNMRGRRCGLPEPTSSPFPWGLLPAWRSFWAATSDSSPATRKIRRSLSATT